MLTQLKRQQKRGWYEGLTRGLPSHDNALEGTNAWIKKITLRDLLSVSQFLNILETKIIGPWSKERNTIDFNTTKEIHMFPPIETALWTNAYKYHQEQRRVIKFKLDGINYQCVGCQNETANKAKADAFVSKTKSLEFENFNDYIDVMRSVRWVNLNPECWQLSTCSCSKWAKNYICKHVISMSKNAGYFQSFPAVAVAIESKNKRGRKPIAQTAFTRQEYIHHTQQLFPDLFKDLPATAASTSTAASASTSTPRRRGRSPSSTPKTPRQPSTARSKSKASERTSLSLRTTSLRKRNT